MSKGLSKYINAFDYFDKSSIVLSATSSGIYIASFGSTIGASIGILSVSFSFLFSLTKRIVKKKKKHEIRKKKHNKIVMLARPEAN